MVEKLKLVGNLWGKKVVFIIRNIRDMVYWEVNGKIINLQSYLVFDFVDYSDRL